MKSRILSASVYILTSLMGVVAFLYPFWMPSVARSSTMGMAHASDAPLMLTLLVGVSFAVLLLEVQGESISAKTVALLGVLVAINSVLRFAEAILPLPGGFSPIFLLIVLSGYIFGGKFGFLMGALTLLVSGLITGSVGPWLPYQMFTAGWMGMSAPLMRPLVNGLGVKGRWGEVALLAAFIGAWGLLYGVIMNIWFWPFISGVGAQYWEPGMGLAETVQRYAVFYLATSLVWDAARLVGNVTLMAVFGAPILRVLRRFQLRFTYDYDPAPAPITERGVQPTYVPAPAERAA